MIEVDVVIKNRTRFPKYVQVVYQQRTIDYLKRTGRSENILGSSAPNAPIYVTVLVRQHTYRVKFSGNVYWNQNAERNRKRVLDLHSRFAAATPMSSIINNALSAEGFTSEVVSPDFVACIVTVFYLVCCINYLSRRKILGLTKTTRFCRLVGPTPYLSKHSSYRRTCLILSRVYHGSPPRPIGFPLIC